MKKLFKFLSLALASISLLLPSAYALKPIDESVLEEMIKDPTVINAYAEEAHREYKQLKSEGKLDELTTLKIEIASAVEKLAKKDAEYNKPVGGVRRHGYRDSSIIYVSKLSACFALNLYKLFAPSSEEKFTLEELGEGSILFPIEYIRNGSPLKICLIEKVKGYVICSFDIE